ncbi:PrgI family protein [Streptacidiphilus monticola]
MSSTEREHASWDALVKIPADVEKPDTLLGQLTARQTAWLAGTVGVLWLGWHALRSLVPALVYLVGSALVLAVVAAVVLTRRDGVPLERWLADAVRHRHAPKRLLATPPGGRPAVLPSG